MKNQLAKFKIKHPGLDAEIDGNFITIKTHIGLEGFNLSGLPHGNYIINGAPWVIS